MAYLRTDLVPTLTSLEVNYIPKRKEQKYQVLNTAVLSITGPAGPNGLFGGFLLDSLNKIFL